MLILYQESKIVVKIRILASAKTSALRKGIKSFIFCCSQSLNSDDFWRL